MSFFDLPFPESGLIIMIFLIAFLLLVISTLQDVWWLGLNYFRNNAIKSPDQVPMTAMRKINVPFTFKLGELTSYNGVKCIVSSQSDFKLVTIWEVPIPEFHMSLWLPWFVMKSSLERGTFLEGCYRHLQIHSRKMCPVEEIISLPVPSDNFELGAPPRPCYPLVILFYKDADDVPELQDTVALIITLHVRDPRCPLSTTILAQYLKLASGQLLFLKRLFLPYDTIDDDNDDDDEVNGLLQLCIVCQNLPLSVALIPCRHTCVCGSCLKKLKICPLCRTPIKSYFCI